MDVHDHGERPAVEYGNGGWVRVTAPDLPGPLYLRFSQDESGRWHTSEIYLQGESRPVVAADLRGLPLAELETIILADEGRKLLADHARTVAPDLSTLASYFGTTFGSQAKHWVAESYRAQMRGERIRKEPEARRIERRPVAPLAPPGPDGLTDEFLRHVAAAYADAVGRGQRPAQELAAQADVSPRNVHRWVYLARQRGLMAPGRRGHVGS